MCFMAEVHFHLEMPQEDVKKLSLALGKRL